MKVIITINVTPNSSRDDLEQVIQDLKNKISGDCHLWHRIEKIEIIPNV